MDPMGIRGMELLFWNIYPVFLSKWQSIKKLQQSIHKTSKTAPGLPVATEDLTNQILGRKSQVVPKPIMLGFMYLKSSTNITEKNTDFI